MPESKKGHFCCCIKKQYCSCFQICYGNSLPFKAKLIVCSCINFLGTIKSLSSGVWSYSLIFSVGMQEAIMVCRQTITVKVSQQKPVVVRSQSGNHCKSFTPELVQSFTAKASSRYNVVSWSRNRRKNLSPQNWCKVLQQKPVVICVRSGNHHKSFTPELVQSFTAKASSGM